MKGLLASEQIQELAKEESVRGVLVCKALEDAGTASEDELTVLEKSLQLLLDRFQRLEGEGS